MKSIQTKFICLILGCVFLCSVVIGGAGLYSAQQVVSQDSARIMNLQCSEKSQELNALLSRIEQSVKTLAVYAVEELDDVERMRTDSAYVDAYTARLEDVAVNAASNTEGAVAVYVRYNPEFTQPTSGLFWSKTDLNGSFQPHTPTDLSRYTPDDVEHVGWYYIPVRSGKATWMAPYNNQNINIQMISYVIPIYVGGTTVGVVGMDIDFSVLQDVVDSVQVYESGYAFLTDDQARIMYHRELKSGTSMLDTVSGLSEVGNELKQSTSGSTLFSYTWRGVEKRLSFSSLNNGMRLAITAPRTEIDAEKDRLILQIGVFTALIAAGALAVTVMMTRRLIRPLKELNEAAQKIAAGDLSVSLSRRTRDEVGTLADSFQLTVNHLQKYIDYINGLAYRDGLTGVKNKTAFQEAASRLEEETRVGRPQFAVVVMDINGLKAVNDTHGHDFGDMLIMDTCKIICKVFKRSPVYRVGGDEFVVVLEHVDYDHYEELMELFESTIVEYNLYSRPDVRISIARGIAVYREGSDLTFGDVFKRADEAMYQNKASMKAILVQDKP